MPSPLCRTASQKALTAENEELRSLLRAAGVKLEKNHAQMALMERENANIRQRLYAKKNKKKRVYTIGQARLMTSAEMHEALLKDLQKKQMGELHSKLKKKVFPGIRKLLSDAVKAAKAKARQEAQEAKAAEKAAKVAEKVAEKAAAKAAKAAARGRVHACADAAAGGPAVPVVAVGPRLEVEEQRGAMTMNNRAQNLSLLTKNAIPTRKDPRHPLMKNPISKDLWVRLPAPA
jgi:hypothetical protein